LKKYIIVLFLALITLSGSLFAQGEIFTEEAADSLFGGVLEEVVMPNDLVEDFVFAAEANGDGILFNIFNGQLVVLDMQRNSILNCTGVDFQEFREVKFKLSTIDKVKELLDSNNAKFIQFQEREKAFCVQKSSTVLERMADCPPWCITRVKELVAQLIIK